MPGWEKRLDEQPEFGAPFAGRANELSERCLGESRRPRVDILLTH